MSFYIFSFVSSPRSPHNRPNAQGVGHHHARFYPLIGASRCIRASAPEAQIHRVFSSVPCRRLREPRSSHQEALIEIKCTLSMPPDLLFVSTCLASGRPARVRRRDGHGDGALRPSGGRLRGQPLLLRLHPERGQVHLPEEVRGRQLGVSFHPRVVSAFFFFSFLPSLCCWAPAG